MPRKRFLAFALFPLAACAIAFFSFIPQPPQIVPWDLLDKAEHFTAYALLSTLGFFFFRALVRKDLHASVPAALSCIAWGGLIELIQPVFGRTADPADFVIDAAAALVALAVILLIRRLSHRDSPAL